MEARPSKTVTNGPDTAVCEAIDGLLLTRPDLIALEGAPGIRVVARRLIDRNHVSILSGGGSGHEPGQAGYVGSGMLTAAICGDIFASPHVKAIFAALMHCRTEAGSLLIVLNYTGDRLAFALAAEQARSHGVVVEVLYVDDDSAELASSIIGPRGLAGAELVIKVAGAVASTGASLNSVATAARAVATSVATMGASLSVCSIPGALLSDRLDGNGIELGLGLHGEPGTTRLNHIPSATELCTTLLKSIATRVLELRKRIITTTSTVLSDGASASIPVALLVNNLGGLSQLEMLIIIRSAVAILDSDITIPIVEGHNNDSANTSAGSVSVRFHLQRMVAGSLMTSLDMRGFSLSLLPLDTPLYTNTSDSNNSSASCSDSSGSITITQALDAPVTMPAWPGVIAPPNGADRISLSALMQKAPLPSEVSRDINVEDSHTDALTDGPPPGSIEACVLACTEKACDDLMAAAARLDELDRICGDGDCGRTFLGMAIAVKKMARRELSIAHKAVPKKDFIALMAHFLGLLSDAIGTTAGGTSGVLYAIMFRAASNSLAIYSDKLKDVNSFVEAAANVLGVALSAGLAAISRAANAHRGDRTMLDALLPAADALTLLPPPPSGHSTSTMTSTSAVAMARLAADAARAGADATATMLPRAGRASYVPAESMRGHADPGAEAAAVWLAGIASALLAM